MSRTDIAYRLPSISFNIQCWSSTPDVFTLNNKLIRTTVDNTVYDIKELITVRSNHEQQQSNHEGGVLLNPECIVLIYKNVRHRNDVKLGQFINRFDDDPIRLQVEIDNSLLSFKDIKPSLLSLNVKLASGKCLHYRESLDFSLRLLKLAIKEDLSILQEDQIKSINYLDGVELKNETMTLKELLNTDTVPLDSELNFYLVLSQDFPIRLATPATNTILNRSKVYVDNNTTILTLKKFILDQYKGMKVLELEGIKLIYFGRILTNEQHIKDVVTVLLDDPESNLITFHCVLNEIDSSHVNQESDNGFWSDLRQGRLFEFLPREPNPNFEEEVRRDRIFRESLRNGTNFSHSSDTNTIETVPTPSIPVQDSASADIATTFLDRERNLSYNSTTSTYNSQNKTVEPALISPNRTMIKQSDNFLSSQDALTGETQEELIDLSNPDKKISLDQTLVSSEVYTIKINIGTYSEKSIRLGTSQCQINNSDPSNPYMMLSPSGLAKLQSLGVNLDLPDLEIIDDSIDPIIENLRQAERNSNWVSEQVRILSERMNSVSDIIRANELNGQDSLANNNNNMNNDNNFENNFNGEQPQNGGGNLQPLFEQFQQLQQNLRQANQINQGQGIHQPHGFQVNRDIIQGRVIQFNFNIDFRFFFMLGKVLLFYYIFSGYLHPDSFWGPLALIIGCVAFVLSRPTVRPYTDRIYRAIVPEIIRLNVEQRFLTIYRLLFRDFEELVRLYRSVLSFVGNIQNPLLQAPVYVLVDLTLFVLSLLPQQYAAFVAAVDQERLAAQSEAHDTTTDMAPAPIEEVAGSQDETVQQINEDIIGLATEIDPAVATGTPVSNILNNYELDSEEVNQQNVRETEEPAHIAETLVDEELIQEQAGASGSRQYTEN